MKLISSTAVLFLAAAASAQSTLTTEYLGVIGTQGVMFNVDAFNDITVDSFSLNLSSSGSAETIEVYTCNTGSFWGQRDNPSEWTLATTVSVQPVGLGIPTPLCLNLGTTVLAGTTQGFYLTTTGAALLNDSPGIGPLTITVQNADFRLMEGVGKDYPFGTNHSPRTWNGSVHYTLGLSGNTAPCPPAAWQTNDLSGSGLNLEIDGLQNLPTEPIGVSAPAGTPSVYTLNAGALAGQPHEIFVSSGSVSSLRPNRGWFPDSDAIINIDPLTASPLFSLSLPPLSSLSFPGVAPQGAMDAQVAALDPSAISGVRTSAAITHDNLIFGCHLATTNINAGDDSTFIQAIPFTFMLYGQSYSSVFINSNGTVSFGAGNVSYNESISNFLLDSRTVAVWWDDLSPNVQGGVYYGDDGAGIAHFCWDDVPEYIGTGSNSFFLELTPGSIIMNFGAMSSLDGLVGISPGSFADPVGTPLDLSAGPNPLPGGLTAVFELFQFHNDLVQRTLTWTLDASGFPIHQN